LVTDVILRYLVEETRFLAAVEKGLAAAERGEFIDEEEMDARLEAMFKDTRMPVSAVFENLESGASIEEIMEWFGVTREQIVAVLNFVARSLDSPPPAAHSLTSTSTSVDAHSI
jgi:hypothetical protein